MKPRFKGTQKKKKLFPQKKDTEGVLPRRGGLLNGKQKGKKKMKEKENHLSSKGKTIRFEVFGHETGGAFLIGSKKKGHNSGGKKTAESPQGKEGPRGKKVLIIILNKRPFWGGSMRDRPRKKKRSPNGICTG